MKLFVDSISIGAWTWVEEILQWIGMWIDALVYKILAAIYNIFMAIVKLDITHINDLFDNLLTRIYLVLGLFMLFKISFNLLQMLVNPDKVKDSNIGGQAMVKNIFISLVMLVAFPLVFQLLGAAQTAIIENGVIEKIVLGDSEGALSDEKAGAAFSWNLLQAFLHPTKGNDWSTSSKVAKAYSEVWDGTDYKLTQMVSVVTDSTISYTPIISSIVGIFVIFYLISFSFDVGSRIFKLMFLEILAPIPIISYMDPGKGKGVFDRYRDEYISTYLELFVRLAIVYFALLLSNKVMLMLTADSNGIFSIGDDIKLSGLSLALAKVILVISIFNFAKTVPNLINSVFGFKNSSSGGNNKGLITGALLGAAGVAGGAIIGAGGAAVGSAMRGESFGKAALNTLGGAGRSAVGMGKAGLGTKSLSVGSLSKMGSAATAGVRRQGVVSEATTAAGGWWNMKRGQFDAATGGEYRAKKQAASYDQALESANKGLESAAGRMSEFDQMRRIAEQQYAQSNGMTLEEARKRNNFDTDVDNWIRTSGSGNAQFNTALDNFNAKNGTTVTTASFTTDSSSATTAYQSAARKVAAAKNAKSSWENKSTRGLGTNKERMERREAANSLRSNK